MIHVKSWEIQLIEQISERLRTGYVGLIYLDIVDLPLYEEKFGRHYCEQILNSMRGIVSELRKDAPSCFAQKMVEDDLFLFVLLRESNRESSLEILNSLSMRIKSTVELELRKLYPIEPVLSFFAGCSIMIESESKEIEAVIYSAMKTAISRSKRSFREIEYDPDWEHFQDIILNQKIRSVYQPIVSLADASVFGYEALTRGPVGSVFEAPLNLFEYAEREGFLHALDKLAREKAIAGCQQLLKYQKVFINVPAHIINDPQFTPGRTLKVLETYGLKPQNVVFEITERSSVEDFGTTKKVLEHYRSQGYLIAIDDAGAGYSSLQAIAELEPDFIKIDRSLVQNIHQDRVKEYILDTFVTFSQKMGIRLIAEGIEKVEELNKLIQMGVHFAQGFYLAKPSASFEELPEPKAAHIREQKRYSLPGGSWTIGELIEPIHTMEKDMPVSEAADYFRSNAQEQGLVVVSDHAPVGLLMREKLFQQLAETYGVPLFWNKPVRHLMDPHPLVVDYLTSVEFVSQMAMAREINRLYDFVVVVQDGRMAGTVSIRTILECITSMRMERAQTSNPLTGLPGNSEIERMLQKRIKERERFSVIYADLDYFKWFNDTYGFQKGDQLIRFTADIMQQSMLRFGHSADFLGHIGGDDFIMISGAEHPETICEEAIHRFDSGVVSFYEGHQPRMVQDRQGRHIDHDGVTLSLSLIICHCAHDRITVEAIADAAARLKKRAKTEPVSTWVCEVLEDGSGTVSE
jgi:diguanylate cyclase (GGDEF)-like protein